MAQLTFAIVSPYQGTPLNDVARISFSRTAKILAKHRWIFALPEGTSTSELCSLKADLEFRFFPQYFFVSKRAAQLFYMHPIFYDAFSDLDYILVHQPDVYVFQDQLSCWMDYMSTNQYDYVGAPWLNHEWLRFARNPMARLPWHWFLNEKVGSGGFSIRNPKRFSQIARRYYKLIKRLSSFIPEDVWWCQLVQMVGESVRRPPADVALRFAFETQSQRCLELNNGLLPFAVHGWNRHDWNIWRELIPGASGIYHQLSLRGVEPL